MRRDKTNYTIQSVAHALDVVEQFADPAAAELGVTELSKRLKLHKNNVFRLLATLESRGYIEQNRASENYRLGIRCLQLGQAYVQNGQADLALEALADAARLSGGNSKAISLRGYILARSGRANEAREVLRTLETDKAGVFAIGDVRAGSTKRVAAAVGEGAAVVAQIHGYLADVVR